jgi:hypothetical protein
MKHKIYKEIAHFYKFMFIKKLIYWGNPNKF